MNTITPHNAKWYESWFNSPYYHILYQNRNQQEAQLFVNAIANNLQLKLHQKVLDLACGKGRFANELFAKKLKVVAFDLAEKSIDEAQKTYSQEIQFMRHDMLMPFPIKGFDYIFNFYTSFGYFGENNMLKVLKNMYNALNEKGIILIDYFNATKVKNQLRRSNTISRNNIDFHITRKVESPYIKKDIQIVDKERNEELHFQEKVYDLNLNEMKNLLNKSHFLLKSVFGNYQMHPFDVQLSDRLIIVAQKKN